MDKKKIEKLYELMEKAKKVIGTSDGLIGILLDSGEYVDVPEGMVKKIK